MAKGVGKVLLFSKLQDDHYKLLCHIFDIIKFCTSRSMSQDEIYVFEERIVEVLCQFEKIVPKTELGIILHLFVLLVTFFVVWARTFAALVPTKRGGGVRRSPLDRFP